MFWAVVIFFAFQLNANFFFGAQQSPFIYWNLYPSPIPAQELYSFYEVECDGQVVSVQHTWQEPGTLLIRNTVDFFMFMQTHGKSPLRDYINRWNNAHPAMAAITPKIRFYPDTAEMNLFPGWLSKMMERNLKRTVRHINIYKTSVQYGKGGTVSLVSRQKVCKIK